MKYLAAYVVVSGALAIAWFYSPGVPPAAGAFVTHWMGCAGAVALWLADLIHKSTKRVKDEIARLEVAEWRVL